MSVLSIRTGQGREGIEYLMEMDYDNGTRHFFLITSGGELLSAVRHHYDLGCDGPPGCPVCRSLPTSIEVEFERALIILSMMSRDVDALRDQFKFTRPSTVEAAEKLLEKSGRKAEIEAKYP